MRIKQVLLRCGDLKFQNCLKTDFFHQYLILNPQMPHLANLKYSMGNELDLLSNPFPDSLGFFLKIPC